MTEVWGCLFLLFGFLCCRYPENPLLSLLSILTTATQFRASVSGCEAEHAWEPALDKAIAAAESVLQQMQLEHNSRPADSSQDGIALCGLAVAILGAISVLRKRLHSMATSDSASTVGKQILI